MKRTYPPKVQFLLPEDVFEDLALVAAAQPGAPTPGPYMRRIALREAKKGRALRDKISPVK